MRMRETSSIMRYLPTYALHNPEATLEFTPSSTYENLVWEKYALRGGKLAEETQDILLQNALKKLSAEDYAKHMGYDDVGPLESETEAEVGDAEVHGPALASG
jgi:hypothetical protein